LVDIISPPAEPEILPPYWKNFSHPPQRGFQKLFLIKGIRLKKSCFEKTFSRKRPLPTWFRGPNQNILKEKGLKSPKGIVGLQGNKPEKSLNFPQSRRLVKLPAFR